MILYIQLIKYTFNNVICKTMLIKTEAEHLTRPVVRYFPNIFIVETSLIHPQTNWLYAPSPLRALNYSEVIKLV